MDKKGMEISINVMVMIILGLVMLIAGITIFFNLFQEISDATLTVDSQLREQLLARCSDQGQICVPETSIRLRNNIFVKDTYVEFHVIITNTHSEEKIFSLSVDPSDSVTMSEPITIGARSSDVMKILVGVEDLPRGQHSFRVEVETDGEQYGRTTIIYVDNT